MLLSKAIADTPSKTKTLYLKKTKKPLGNGPIVSGKKEIFQNPGPRLKIELRTTKKEKIVIPPISNGKGLLGPGPAHLWLKKPKGLDAKHSNFCNCRHCGLNTHITSKCSSAPNAKKSAKGKKAAKAESSSKATVPEPSPLSIVADSSLPNKSSGPIVLWVPKKS